MESLGWLLNILQCRWCDLWPQAVLLCSVLNYDQACTSLSSLVSYPVLTAGLVDNGLWEFHKTLGRETQWKDGRSQTLIPLGMFLASGKKPVMNCWGFIPCSSRKIPAFCLQPHWWQEEKNIFFYLQFHPPGSSFCHRSLCATTVSCQKRLLWVSHLSCPFLGPVWAAPSSYTLLSNIFVFSW